MGLNAAGHVVRTRVVMLLPRLPVAADWMRAAQMIADVTPVTTSPRRFWSEIKVGEGVGAKVIQIPVLRPTRAFGHVNAWIHGRAISTLLLKQSGLRVKPEIFHCHFYTDMEVARHLARRFSASYVVSEHSSALTGLNPNNRISKTGFRNAAIGYRTACAVLPVSHSLASALRKLNLADPERIVPNPVDTERFHPPLIYQNNHVVVVARLEPVKRLDLLIEAFALVVAKEPGARLSIAGKGSAGQALRYRAAALGISDRVTFVGALNRDEVAAFLRAGTVFALTSRTENLPVAAIEAAATGLPIVATDVGGMREIVNSTCGEIVAVAEKKAFAEALLRWLSPSEQHRVRARDGAKRNYSLDAVSRILDSVYENCIDRKVYRK